jgi:hypothetical protein
MVEWLLDKPARASNAAFCATIVLLAIGVWWLGRKRLAASLPIALIVVLVTAVALPSIDWGHRVANEVNCVNNLRQIDSAKIKWVEVSHKLPTDGPTEAELVGTNTNLRFMPACPSGGTYTIGAVNEKPTCNFAKRGHKLE